MHVVRFRKIRDWSRYDHKRELHFLPGRKISNQFRSNGISELFAMHTWRIPDSDRCIAVFAVSARDIFRHARGIIAAILLIMSARHLW